MPLSYHQLNPRGDINEASNINTCEGSWLLATYRIHTNYVKQTFNC
ncbi:hypothetical protein THZB04_60053 [Vibrio owensii]|nr:hypothetical protein THZB04_60053 [Vibrio owensii]